MHLALVWRFEFLYDRGQIIVKRVCFFNEGLVDPFDEPKEQ